MPKVTPGESRSDFVARCIPVVMKEGLTQDQAVGKCEGMYDSHVNKSLEAARTGLVRKLVRKAADASRQIAKAGLPEGTVRSRADGDYRKQGGEWAKVRDRGGQGKPRKYIDPRMAQQRAANRQQDRDLRRAGIDPKQNPADRRSSRLSKPVLTQEQMKQAIAGAHRGGLTPEQLGQLAQHLKDTHEIK